MTDYLHPVSRACDERTENAIRNLSKSELVYVLADVFGVDAPTDENGDEIHPDDYNGTVSKEMMVDLLLTHESVEAADDDDDDDESDD